VEPAPGHVELPAHGEPVCNAPQQRALPHHRVPLRGHGSGKGCLVDGDEIWVVSGASTPLLLRRAQGKDAHTLVGECYVHDIMYGKAPGPGVVAEGEAVIHELSKHDPQCVQGTKR